MILAFCSICTDNFSDKDNISAISCGHTFHKCCLDRWLKQKQLCPTCRCQTSNVIEKLYFNVNNDLNKSLLTEITNETLKTNYQDNLKSLQEYKLKVEELNKSNKLLSRKLKTIDNLNSEKLFSLKTELETSNYELTNKNELVKELRKKLNDYRYLEQIISNKNSNNKQINDTLSCAEKLLRNKLLKSEAKLNNMSQELSRAEIAIRVLEDQIGQLKDPVRDISIENNNINSTPPQQTRQQASRKRKSLEDPKISTPYHLIDSTPETTPVSIHNRSIHSNITRANPFSITATNRPNKKPTSIESSSSNSESSNRHVNTKTVKVKRTFSWDNIGRL